MLKNKMQMHPEASGFIFDGFPRNIVQADALDRLMNEYDQQINLLISLHVDEEEIVKRILSRGATSGRADDNDENIIRNRFMVYKNETSPVYDYYLEKGISKTIDGIGSIEEIFEQICQTIDQAS
jgi:adenylate kinase